MAFHSCNAPQDVAEAKELINGRAWTMVKLEKPQALDNLDAILALTDAGVMVARGDLGVELPAPPRRGVSRWRRKADCSPGSPARQAGSSSRHWKCWKA